MKKSIVALMAVLLLGTAAAEVWADDATPVASPAAAMAPTPEATPMKKHKHKKKKPKMEATPVASPAADASTPAAQ